MQLPKDINSALEVAWNREVAQSSIERWLKLCESEDWAAAPGDRELLVRIFGASWYFTRFMFVHGRQMGELVDQGPPAGVTVEAILKEFDDVHEPADLEQQVNRLRMLKNQFMLRILIASLRQDLDQEQMEHALTCLAEATVRLIARLFNLSPDTPGAAVTILGMGRMAGFEMTFGSDLDLIFVFEGKGEDIAPALERSVRQLLRHIALQTPAGSLYDVDMRLRPHGNAGVLITTSKSFLEYHDRDRDVWERQMMTRCRPVTETSDHFVSLMAVIEERVFAEYDGHYLRQEIHGMRMRVEKELGRPSGKHEIKRGTGGIMDIDFCTHYLQLAHGRDYRELHTGSTRVALRLARQHELLAAADADRLLEAYDFLKRVETALRLFDLKAVSSFPVDPGACIPLARALGFMEDDAGRFLEYYYSVTQEVREVFERVMKAGVDRQ